MLRRLIVLMLSVGFMASFASTASANSNNGVSICNGGKTVWIETVLMKAHPDWGYMTLINYGSQKNHGIENTCSMFRDGEQSGGWHCNFLFEAQKYKNCVLSKVKPMLLKYDESGDLNKMGPIFPRIQQAADNLCKCLDDSSA